MNTTPRKLIAVTTAILMASTSAFAAVKNGASLKGNEYTKGGNNAKGGGVIAWNSFSSLDPTAFSHDLSSSDLTVLKDGDYLVAVTVPISTINSQRNTHRADLLVNGTAAPTGVGESSYIRWANNHSEASDHFAVMVSLKANDVLTVKTTPTAQTGGESFIDTCSLYAELVEGDRNVFSATATEIQSGVELNVEPDIGDQGLVWTSTRKGSGYTHSDGDAEITIKDDGNYMVYANVPLRGNVARASVGLTLNLDDEYIEGARGQQGYIRNANSHQDASIHFSGMIRAEAGQVLTVTTEQLAKVGSIKVQADRAASIFIEKVRNDGLFSDQFTGTTAGEDLNPVNKTALALDGDSVSLSIIDNVTYSNDGDNEENIVIKKAGSYLLSFNSTFTGGNARANPRVTVEVNGSVVPGATSTAHYNRHADGHDESTGSIVALLSDLAVGDVVTVSVQQEGNGGIVTSPEGGKVALQAKAAYSAAAGDQFPPRASSFSGGLSGFSAYVEDFGLKLDAATLKATLNGESVDVTVDSANGVNSINYAFTDFPPTGSEHALNIAFNDTGGNAHSMDFAFTVTTEYKTISPAFSMSDVNKEKGGFRVNLSQISVIQTEGPVQIHGNQWINAEKQLRGEYIDPNTEEPYLNEADPDAWEGWSMAPADVDYVNMNQDEDVNIGNFGEDQTLPNIPGWGDSTDGIAGEFLTVLHLKKGYQILGVNSDEGFSATIGLNFHDMEAQQIGLLNGGRTSADSLFNIVITEEGYYPLRVLWWEGSGAANIEIFSVVDGEKVLVNDPDNENAIKAYNIGNSTGRTYFGSVSPAPGNTFVTENSISATIIEDGTKAKSGSIKVLLNGEEVDASIQSTDGVVTVTAEPGGGLGIGSHTAKIVFTETTDPETERSFEWSFEVTAFSAKTREFVDGEPNPIAYWDFDFADVPDLTFEHVFNLESVLTNAKYTEDKGGHTGETGDRAMDFLTTAANLLVPDGEFLNIASAYDKITVSLWQKNYTTPNTSSFWGYSPSSNGSFRGIQAHIPWGNEQIFFDTAGCCNAATQRINLANAGFEWTEWHHYVFVKDKGHKSIWIDGTLFHEGDNSSALPSDFDFLYIGGNQNGGNSVSGIIDDFAVFASALTEEQIIALSEGNTDILPEKREIEVPVPDIPILLSKSPTGAAVEGEETEISLRFRGIDFTDLSITVNDTAVDPTITSEGAFTTITANGAFSLDKNVITVSWKGESETWNFFQFSAAEGQTGLASYSVETVGAVPGPWAFEDGVWVSDGSVAGCGGPYHDFLTSPDYIVSAAGEVTLSFEHRHAFEGDMWDSGQLWISVNGGAYADVGTDAFSENGYTDVAIIGNGIAKGQNGFGNTSAGYADGNYITTTASLGSFDAGDAISVRFVALYDDCSTGVNPNWVIASVSSDQMAIEPAQTVPGLIAYWPFDGNIDDAIGDSHGEAMGTDDISYDDGQFGMGIDLDGVDQFIQTPLANEEMFDFQDGTGFTVSAWLRVDGFTKSWQALIAKGEGNRWRVHRRGGENVFTANGGNGDVSAGSTDVNDGEIHHVALVSDPAGGEVRFYVDGELEGTSGAPSIQSNDNPMMIGENPDAQGRTWDGLIDDVGIWNRPITEEEVALIYNGGAGTVLVSAGAGGPPPEPGPIVWTGANGTDIFDEGNWDLSNSNVTVIDPNVSIDADVVLLNAVVDIPQLDAQQRFQVASDFTITVDNSTISLSGGSNDGIGGAPGATLPAGPAGPTLNVVNGSSFEAFFIVNGITLNVDSTSTATLGGGGNPVNKSVIDLEPGATLTFTRETIEQFNTEHLSKLTIGGAAAEEGVNFAIESDGNSGSIIKTRMLVAHWSMNEGSGDVFKDVVGGFDGFLPLGQDGAQTEVSWGEGPPTQANSVEFSGANSFIATSFPGIGGANPRTVAFWVRTTDADAYFVSWGANQTARKWHIRANGASGVMRTEYAGGQNFATTSIIDGEWHHVASVVPNGATEGEQILHYIDGVLDPRAGGTNQTIDTAIPTDAVLDWTNFGGAVAYPVHIGARMNANFTSMLDGSIADVRIYNHGLSEDQIRAIFQGKTEDGMNLEGPTIVDFGDLSGDASYEFFFKAIKAGASTAIAGNDAFAFKLDQWNEQGVFGTTVFGVADNVFTPVEGKSVASVFDRDVHVVVVNDTAAGETRLYVDGDHVGVLSGNFELAGEGKVMGARIDANTDPMGEGSVMHKWATYDKALTDEQIAGLADEVAPLPDLVDISNPGDAVVASSDNSPGGEQASNAIDDNDQTKYLNFDGANDQPSGLTITTAGGVVAGLGLTSANDAPDRDPATFVLSGSNDGGATFIEIASGDVPAFGARFERQEVSFANEASYTIYQLIFPTTTGPSTCCMQIAEIELIGTPAVPVDISNPGDAVVASSDNSPGGEQAPNAIDDIPSLKYLNFDGANNEPSGLTITTAGGVVVGLGLTSANDAPDRDPATFVLSGSNDGGATFTEIASGDVPSFGARFERQEVSFANGAGYFTTYELIFPTTVGPSTCCMQIAEIELLGTPGVPGPEAPAPPGLVAHFPLDSDGNSSDGEFTASTVTDVEFGTAGANANTGTSATFNGSSSIIQHDWSADLNPGESFTLSLWARSEGGAGAWHSPVTSRNDKNPDSQGYIIYDNQPAGKWTFWSGNGTEDGNWQTMDGPEATIGEWEHLTIVYDSEAQMKKLYVNGELALESNDSVAENDTKPLNIGAGGDTGTAYFFSGDIDDIGLWNKALSQEDIQVVMEKGVTGLGGGVVGPEVAYEAPEGGWAYSVDVGDISTWNHDNGSDQWDGSAIGGEFGDDNRPGGVSLLDGYVRLQDTGDPRDYGYSDSGSNRKIYLGQSISDQGGSDTILNDGATIHFIARIPTDGPLDPLHVDGGGGVVDYPAGGDGYENHDGGKGNIGIKQGAGGNISFSLSEAGKVLITEDGTEFELSTTEWHEFWVTIEQSDAGHTVSVYLDGSTEANVFTVTAGGGSDYAGSYLAMGAGSTGRSGALDVAAFDFSPGAIAPAGAGGGAAPALSVVNNGDGTVTITFEGKLQAAATVNGPWADVEGATSPLTISADQAQQYGRAVK